jgi:hypothetical protein
MNKMTTSEPRPGFRALDIEGDEQRLFEAGIGLAADRLQSAVDRESIALFNRHGVSLPPRLRVIAEEKTRYGY